MMLFFFTLDQRTRVEITALTPRSAEKRLAKVVKHPEKFKLIEAIDGNQETVKFGISGDGHYIRIDRMLRGRGWKPNAIAEFLGAKEAREEP